MQRALIMCFVCISEQTVSFALYSINSLVFEAEMQSAYCLVRPGSSDKAYYVSSLTLILLKWTIWRAPTNASKWRMGFNSAFKGLKCSRLRITCRAGYSDKTSDWTWFDSWQEQWYISLCKWSRPVLWPPAIYLVSTRSYFSCIKATCACIAKV